MLDDITFDAADETNFIVELPTSSFSGSLSDINGASGTNELDASGTLVEVPTRSYAIIGGFHIIKGSSV